jgi:hypothetical protein
LGAFPGPVASTGWWPAASCSGYARLDRSALEKVHGQDHADQRIDLEERVRKLSSDPGVPARQRWLMATSMAAV